MFRFIRFLFVGLAGVFGGLFFAQKPGKKLRKEMQDSDQPLKTLLKELKRVSSESAGAIKDWADNSEHVQGFFTESKKVMKQLADKAKDLGKEASEKTAKELEDLSAKAKKAASDLKDNLKAKTKQFENKLPKRKTPPKTKK